MRRALMIAVAGFMLSAGAFNDLDAGLKALVGKNIAEGLAQLGYPDSQLKVGDDLVYIWGVQFDAPRYSENGNFTRNLACTVKLVAGPDQIIKTFDWNGNRAACKMYSRRLKERSNASH